MRKSLAHRVSVGSTMEKTDQPQRGDTRDCDESGSICLVVAPLPTPERENRALRGPRFRGSIAFLSRTQPLRAGLVSCAPAALARWSPQALISNSKAKPVIHPAVQRKLTFRDRGQRFHVGDDGVSELAGSRRAANVAGQVLLLFVRLCQRGINPVCCFGFVQVAQH